MLYPLRAWEYTSLSLWLRPDKALNQGELPAGVGLEVDCPRSIRPTYPQLCRFLFASLLQSDHPTPHVGFSWSPVGRARLRCPLAKWSGLGSQLHVFASAPAAGQIFYITSLGFLPQQDRSAMCLHGSGKAQPCSFPLPRDGLQPSRNS